MPIMSCYGYITYPQGGCNYSEEISKRNTQIVTSLGKKTKTKNIIRGMK